MDEMPMLPSGAAPSNKPQSLLPASFDRSDESDLVIHTSNNVHLFVLKAFLIYNSEFFRNLLSDSLPSESYQNLPVLPVAEHSRTMIAVLQLCYPIHIYPPDVLDEIATAPVMQTLRKYIMEKAERRLIDMIRYADIDVWKKYPLRLFAVARFYGDDGLARKAAKHSLRIPLSKWEEAPALVLVNALDYHCLLDYFKRCGQAAPPAVLGFELGHIHSSPSTLGRCQTCGVTLCEMSRGAMVWGHPWIADYLNQSQTMIGQWRSAGFLDQASEDVIFEKAIKSCASQTAGVVRSTLEALENAIDREISKVEIRFD